ncbi:hypothetical protein KC19_10G043600 [Ceratodon purpureus]|uniref:Uncharacterized protein n=1 Tax=Ceratodon purpureus TaxID=3225 RepID=A0A8T0GI18_CERPU|nr:hypothetical protein KC19_10G043600 [Ceratodon purpureus]
MMLDRFRILKLGFRCVCCMYGRSQKGTSSVSSSTRTNRMWNLDVSVAIALDGLPSLRD